MIPISSAISSGLVWIKCGHQRRYELRANTKVVASLQRTTCWSSEYQALSAAESWSIRRTGFFRTGIEIIDASNVRVLKPNWSGGGTLVFSDGQAFRITCDGFWRPVWMVSTESGGPVLRLYSRMILELLPQSGLPEERLTLLVILARYCMSQAEQDASSMAASVAVTS